MEQNKKVIYNYSKLWDSLEPYKLQYVHRSSALGKIIRANVEKLINNYGKWIPMNKEDRINATKIDENSNCFSHQFRKDGIETLYKLFENYDYSIEDHYLYLKEYLLDIKYDEILNKYKNVTLEEILFLTCYVYNTGYFFNYLNIINNCDKETKDLILNIIKPYSRIKLDSFKKFACERNDFANIISYLTDNTVNNDINENKKYHDYCWVKF